jgi:predicted metalloprotease with PDZ domain
MRNFTISALLLSGLLCAQTPVRLRVDATDAPRRLFHVQMTMPVKSGPMTLMYPQWIPGEHMPSGPVANLVGLKIQGGGQTIAWRRDSVNMFAFHIEVPAGVSSLDVVFDLISPPESDAFSAGASATSELAVVSWNQLLLYPQGADPDTMQYQASVRVPNSWRFGTALPIQKESGSSVDFQPAPLTTLIDSPLTAGSHYRTIDLGTVGGQAHYLHVAADSDRALEATDETIGHYKKLVAEAGALFGAHHYRSYHFLYTLSDHVAHFGLEHHESSDDRVGERALIDPGPFKVHGSLLPHEFVHSWNGKFRRPFGLMTGDHDGGYETPMKGDLLWVYEGLTDYLGDILAPRSGIWTAEEYRDMLAEIAASLDTEYGRTWRPLEDTAVAAQTLYEAGGDYTNYRRTVDYYPEGDLIWLEADVIIRQLSKGAKSLDDFCRTFEGGSSGRPAVKGYNFDDVVSALNGVQVYDWRGFLNERLHSTSAHAPLGGIERSGWKLAYDGNRSEFWKSVEEERKGMDLTYSIGLRVSEEGVIGDVRFDGPAKKAGIAPSMKLIAVNSRQFSPTILREAVAKTASDSKPIELLVKTGDYYEVHRVEYTGGEKYPHLVRDNSVDRDLLSEIIAGKTK